MNDSIECIKEDAIKFAYQYWNCENVLDCDYCPSRIDDKTPCEYYETSTCLAAMNIDLIERTVKVTESNMERTCHTEEAYGTIGNGCVLDNCKLPRCSACHYPTRFEAHGFKYCPNCGAKVVN